MKHLPIRQPLSVAIISFVLLLSLITIRAFGYPYTIETGTHSDMPLGILIDSLFSQGWLKIILSAVLIFINSILLTRIIIKYSISSERTYLPMIMFLLPAYCIFMPTATITEALSSLLLIISSMQMIAGFKRSYQFAEVFKSAFALGFIPLLYSPAICLVAILPITLIIYNRTLREALAGVVGLLTPILLCSFCWWLAGYEPLYLIHSLTESLSKPYEFNILSAIGNKGITALTFSVLHWAIILYSLFTIILRLSTLRPRVKKIFIHFINLFICIAAMLLVPSNSIITFSISSVPIALISTIFFIVHKGRISTIIYYILLGLAFAVNIIPLIN